MKIGPFLKRKEIWIPTWKGWLLAISLVAALTIAFTKTVPYFLAPNRPLNARVLVAEGWFGNEGILAVKRLQQLNNYDLVIISGGPIDTNHLEATYVTYANFGAVRLRNSGYTATNLIPVAAKRALKDRTYHSALGVREYLLKNTNHRAFDLISAGVHTRRSWLLYRKACGPEIQVGVYAVDDPEFRLDSWYRTSAGVRNVLSEAIGYIYARFFFRPAAFALPADETTASPLPQAHPASAQSP